MFKILSVKKAITKIIIALIAVVTFFLISNFSTLFLGKYQTDISGVVINIPKISLKGKVNTFVHPHLYTFYTFHSKEYVNDFFYDNLFSKMKKIQYGYEDYESNIALEDFRIIESKHKLLRLLPIVKFEFSYRNLR